MPGIIQRACSAVAMASMLAACNKAAPPPPPPPAVTVAPAVGRIVNEWDEFTGRIEAVDRVEVRPRVSGYIRRVAFKEGSEVRKGDILFVIDQREYRAAFERAEAQLAQATTQYELSKSESQRADALIKENAISREEFDARTSGTAQAEAAIKAAQAAVEAARLDVEWAVVRAPISGRVSRAEVTEGNLVQQGSSLLTTVVSLDPVYVYFESDEQAYLRYNGLDSAGVRKKPRNSRDPVRMGLANEQGFPHVGQLDFIDNQLDPRTGTIRVRAVFDNKDRLFTPGLFARVQLLGRGTFEAVLVRDGAIGTDQDRKFVYVLKPDSTIDYRAVEPGRIVDGLRIIRKGLGAGENIVINGLQRVRPGVKAAPTFTTMEASGDSMQTAQRGE